MTTDCAGCPLRKHSVFDPLSESEVAFMSRFKTGELVVDPGGQLMLEGSNSPHLYTALEGMGLRYKTLEGGERQVINFVMPGDFIGLQAGVMKEMYHSVEATSRMKLCVFNREALWSLFRDHPGRAYDLTWLSAVEERVLGESLAVLGQMDGMGRVARAFVRLHDRAAALGLAKGGEMALPYRQQDLADALGLSLVHTNKTLKKLREQGLAEWRQGRLKVSDRARLAEIAQLDPEAGPELRPLI